ncbi:MULTISPECIES: hypothetical protein [unclassified Crossiella]|uniref:hypothetical protein n=1 Tax=unclassified Crossiella TaxID=2620835 RepID=UPI001FFFCFCC|nr:MULTISPECIES: hypothetical protein [unclassified Crossiella]MCK2242065.1 hypothetical protein [Crossiella sp. S99.2]MCK2255968.1 hypothetical protein [Crossiella sp. S99.1]
MNQLNRYVESARTAAGSGAARGARRFLFRLLLVGGLLAAVLVIGAVAIGVWLIVNADSALAWLNGVLDRLGPIATFFGRFTGG